MPNKVSRQPTSSGQAWRWTPNHGQISNLTSSKNRDAVNSAEMHRRSRGNSNRKHCNSSRSSIVNNVNTHGHRHVGYEGAIADRMQSSWREPSTACNTACSSHDNRGNHSRGAFRSQFETVNSYSALIKVVIEEGLRKLKACTTGSCLRNK